MPFWLWTVVVDYSQLILINPQLNLIVHYCLMGLKVSPVDNSMNGHYYLINKRMLRCVKELHKWLFDVVDGHRASLEPF
jgi:hypothetical protein